VQYEIVIIKIIIIIIN